MFRHGYQLRKANYKRERNGDLLVDRVESTEVFRIPSPTRGTATETRHRHGVEIPFLALYTPRQRISARSRVMLRNWVEGNVTSSYTMHRGRGWLGNAGSVGECKCGRV